MNKIIGILFAVVCFSTSALSSHIMGVGMWFWVIIVTGLFSAISQYYPVLRGVGSGLAVLLGILSLLDVGLGLLASTIGGSFKIDFNSAVLLLLFFIIFILGLMLGSMYKKSIRKN
jgi:hypothetical protein